jgi:hypothetical protein
VLDGVEPGDAFLACAPQRIHTTVITGGEIHGYWANGCLTITVMSVEPGAGGQLVIELRGAGGGPLCADVFERLPP